MRACEGIVATSPACRSLSLSSVLSLSRQGCVCETRARLLERQSSLSPLRVRVSACVMYEARETHQRAVKDRTKNKEAERRKRSIQRVVARFPAAQTARERSEQKGASCGHRAVRKRSIWFVGVASFGLRLTRKEGARVGGKCRRLSSAHPARDARVRRRRKERCLHACAQVGWGTRVALSSLLSLHHEGESSRTCAGWVRVHACTYASKKGKNAATSEKKR